MRRARLVLSFLIRYVPQIFAGFFISEALVSGAWHLAVLLAAASVTWMLLYNFGGYRDMIEGGAHADQRAAEAGEDLSRKGHEPPSPPVP